MKTIYEVFDVYLETNNRSCVFEDDLVNEWISKAKDAESVASYRHI